MNKSLLIIGLAIINTIAHADPSKTDAERWLLDFRLARDRTNDALFIHHFDNRRKLTAEIESLKARAEKLFDKTKYQACVNTINSVNSYWTSEVWLMSSPTSETHVTISGVVDGAWEAGQTYVECRQLINALKSGN